MWQGHPCFNPVQPESSVDKVRHNVVHKSLTMNVIPSKTDFRFLSDDWGNGRGFQIQYNTLQLFTKCGGFYSNSSGVLSSPSYPNEYPEMAECVYLITQPSGTYVNISFLSMDIDCQGPTPLTSDYMELRDGNSEESPLMARLCGNGSNIPDIIQTTHNHLRLR